MQLSYGSPKGKNTGNSRQETGEAPSFSNAVYCILTTVSCFTIDT